MDAFHSVVLQCLIAAAILAVLFILYRAQNKTSAAWIQKTALLIKWFFALICVAFFLGFILPLVIEEGLMWLAPENSTATPRSITFP